MCKVQVVAYFHEWNASAVRGGDFVFWRENASHAEVSVAVFEAFTESEHIVSRWHRIRALPLSSTVPK
jgi:hypothetical protein